MQHQTSSKTIGSRSDYMNGSKSRKFEENITMYDWHNEWATASCDPLPSNLNHLHLLNQPAEINMKNHAEKAKIVSLIHYDVNLVPEGRASQELRRRHKVKERRLKEDAEEFVMEMERAEKRHEVVKAAKVAEVIDLTEDETGFNRASRRLPSRLAGLQQANVQPDLSALPCTAEFRQNTAFSFTSGRNERLVKAPWRAPQRPRAQNFHTAPEDSTRFIQNPMFQKAPDYFTSHEFSKQPAINVPSPYQVTYPHLATGIWPFGFGYA